MAESNIEKKSVLIVGGGIAGITAALELSRLRKNVTVVEKAPFIGGHGVLLSCKASDYCLKCNNCLVEDKLAELGGSCSITLKTSTRVTNIEKKDGLFHISLVSYGNCIDPTKCTNCGLCLDKCIEVGANAVKVAPSSYIRPSYAIDLAACNCNNREGQIFPCEAACPQDAIHIKKEKTEWSMEAQAILVATGFQPYDPSEDKRYGIGRLDNVITAMELEEMWKRQGRILCKPEGQIPKRIAFVQCVGSRNHRIGHDYCSRVCCGYALRMALRLVHEHPKMDITVFYMDIQNFGKDFDRYYGEAKDRLRLIRGLPGEYYASEGSKVSLSFFADDKGTTVHEDFDLVVLSVGITPLADNVFFKEKLGLDVGADGFLAVHGQGHSGVFLAGTVNGPMDVAESIASAKSAALGINDFLENI